VSEVLQVRMKCSKCSYSAVCLVVGKALFSSRFIRCLRCGRYYVKIRPGAGLGDEKLYRDGLVPPVCKEVLDNIPNYAHCAVCFIPSISDTSRVRGVLFPGWREMYDKT
jgi:hypothetical protein